MFITAKDLLHLPVYTQGERFLGKVIDFEIDIDSQSALKFHVKTGGLVSGLFGKLLIIDQGQVVSISKEKMIVKDSVVEERIRDSEKAKLGVPAGVEVRSEVVDVK